MGCINWRLFILNWIIITVSQNTIWKLEAMSDTKRVIIQEINSEGKVISTTIKDLDECLAVAKIINLDALVTEYANMKLEDIIYTNKGYIFVEKKLGSKRRLHIHGPDGCERFSTTKSDLRSVLKSFVDRENS